jgi:tetratricopeptide (TPR) repeat protein
LFPRVNLMTAYCALNKFAECADAARQILARVPDNPSAHVALYAIARHGQDKAAAERELAWAEQHPADSGVLYVEAEDAGRGGHFAEMTRLFRRVAQMTHDAGNDEGAGNTLAYSAVINSLAGRTDEALADAATAAAYGRNEIILGSVGVVDARAGRAHAATEALVTMNRLYPLSTYALGMYAPMVQSAQLAQKSAPAAEVTAVTSAGLPYEFGQQGSMTQPYLRGLAYLAAHSPELALVEFQKTIDHVGVDPVSPVSSMAYLGVGRAAIEMGKGDDSRKAYQTLTRLWMDADADAPIVRQAFAESARAASTVR